MLKWTINKLTTYHDHISSRLQVPGDEARMNFAKLYSEMTRPLGVESSNKDRRADRDPTGRS